MAELASSMAELVPIPGNLVPIRGEIVTIPGDLVHGWPNRPQQRPFLLLQWRAPATSATAWPRRRGP